MAILDMQGNVVDDPFPIVGRIPAPSAGETLWTATQQAGLGTIGQLATIPRIIGDLFNAPSLSQWGRDVNLNAKQAAEELTPLGEGSVQRVLREATVNTAQSLPALVSGGLVPALTIMGGQTYMDGYSKARDGGLSVGRSHIFAGIDAIFETATEAWSLPVLFKSNIGIVRRANEFLMKEMAGEEVTTIGQTMNELLQLHPEMSLGEYATKLKEAMVQTALVTPPTAMMQFGVARAAQRFRRMTSQGTPLVVDGDIPQPGGPSVPTTSPPTIPPEQVLPQQQTLPGMPPVPAAPTALPPLELESPQPGQAPPGDSQQMELPLPLPGQMELPFDGQTAAPVPMPAPPPNTVTTPEHGASPPVSEPKPVTIPKQEGDVLDQVMTPETGPELPGDVAPVIPQAGGQQYVQDYRNHTPEELAKMDYPDLRLYQGVIERANRLAVVTYDNLDNKWTVNFTANPYASQDEVTAVAMPNTKMFDADTKLGYEEARALLEQSTGFKLTEQNIKLQHQVLSFRDAVSRDGVLTPAQLKYYGEKLGRIADKAKVVRGKQGYDTHMTPWLSWEGALGGPSLVYNQGLDPVVELGAAGQIKLGKAQDGTYVVKDSVDPAGSKKLQALLERWRKQYGINTAIAIRIAPGKEAGSASVVPHAVTLNENGGSRIVYEIEVSPKDNINDQATWMSHEFGHIIGFEMVLKADPQVSTELVEAWLDSLGELPSFPKLGEQINAASGVVRATVFERLYNLGADNTSPSQKYAMSFNEFIADQVGQHLYENKYFAPRSKGVQQLLAHIGDVLKRFFTNSAQKFNPKLAFRDYLDKLAGITPDTPKQAKPGKTVIEKPKSGAVVKHKTATPGPKEAPSKYDPEAVKERAWLLGLLKKYGMLDIATRETIDPNGSVEGFDFEQAKELLDAIGINWEAGVTGVGNTPKRLTVGDIVLMKSPSQAMAQRYPDSGKIVSIAGDIATIQGDDGKVIQRKLEHLRDAVQWLRENPHNTRPAYRPNNRDVDLRTEVNNAPRTVDEPDTWQFRNALSLAIPKLAGTDEALRHKLADSSLSIRNFGRLWRSTLTALQIRKIYGGTVPGVKHFVDGLQAMSAYANKVRRRAEMGLSLMRETGENQRNRVFELMIKEADTGKYLNTPQDFMTAGLNVDGIKLYNTLREDYRYALDTMQNLAHKALLEDLGVTLGPDNVTLVNTRTGEPLSKEKNQMLENEQKKIDEAFAKMRAKPYYPHTRFGDYYAVARMEDGKTLAFTQGESLAEVRKYAEAIAGDGVTSWYGEMPEAVKPFMNMPYQVFEMMKNQLELTPKQIAEFEDILKNLAPEQSFIRKFKTRKDVTGWENNPDQGPQVYAEYFSKFANYAARRFHSAALDKAIAETRSFKKEIFGEETATNVVLIDRLTNWMAETKDYAMRPDIAAANIRAAVTLWYLGAVPKSALVNSLSVPMMTLPWLGKRYGDIKAAAALKQAYMDVGKMFKRAESLTPDERALLDYLEEIGVADQSYASTMAAVTEGGKLMEATMLGKGSLKAHAYNLKWFAMWGFHKVEVMNRLVTGMAAYRLAKAEMGHTGDRLNMAAAEIAKDAIQDTQNENLQWNRPELMRGKKSLLTLFMSYTQNAMFQMYGGDQSWQRMLALQLMIAGALGLPLAKNLNDVIEWFAKEVFGTKASAESALRDFLKGTIINPEWVLKGTSYNFLNTGVNLHGSLSMGNLIPGIDALVLEGTFPERLANAASDVGGAGAAVMMSFMQAMADNNPDSMKAWSRAMPTAIKNSYEGYKMLTDGVVTDGTGDAIAKVSGAEGTAKVLGFQSTNVSQTRERLFEQKQMVQYWMTRRKMVFDLHELAEKTGDVKTELAAEKAIEQFNDDVPDSAMTIRKRDLQNAMRRREKNAEKKEEGLPTSKKYTEVYEQVGSRYPAQ